MNRTCEEHVFHRILCSCNANEVHKDLFEPKNQPKPCPVYIMFVTIKACSLQMDLCFVLKSLVKACTHIMTQVSTHRNYEVISKTPVRHVERSHVSIVVLIGRANASV